MHAWQHIMISLHFFVLQFWKAGTIIVADAQNWHMANLKLWFREGHVEGESKRDN